jgi:hypothetical protein
VITPLHSRNIDVDGDRICKLAPTQVAQETQDENEDFELQRNANDFQNQPIPNVLKVLKNTSFMDLSQENTDLLPSNGHKPPMVNLFNYPTTFTQSNTIVKKKRNNFFFSFVIDSTNTNKKILVGAMEKINAT